MIIIKIIIIKKILIIIIIIITIIVISGNTKNVWNLADFLTLKKAYFHGKFEIFPNVQGAAPPPLV